MPPLAPICPTCCGREHGHRGDPLHGVPPADGPAAAAAERGGAALPHGGGEDAGNRGRPGPAHAQVQPGRPAGRGPPGERG
eukprot:scaffold238791_cov26-Prasinocladus_malaysianus.AAC.1